MNASRNKSGVYCIENLINNKKYIGCSKNIRRRLSQHLRNLEKGNHINKSLQSDFYEHGKENFYFYTIEECEEKLLSEKEVFYISFYKNLKDDCLYNLINGGGGMINKEVSDSFREKRRKYMLTSANPTLNVGHSEETKKKMMGREVSEETRIKQSSWQKGKDKSEKYKNARTGYKIGKHTSSIYVGVAYLRGVWQATIKNTYIGRYKTEKEAALAYNKKARELFGENAKLNKIEEAHDSENNCCRC